MNKVASSEVRRYNFSHVFLLLTLLPAATLRHQWLSVLLILSGVIVNEEINKVPAGSPDFRTEAATKLAELFPETVSDGKIDIDKIKELLGEDSGGGNDLA